MSFWPFQQFGKKNVGRFENLNPRKIVLDQIEIWDPDTDFWDQVDRFWMTERQGIDNNTFEPQ